MGEYCVVKWGSGLRDVDEMGQYGECGYLVVGLTKMVCPKSGSDLREVGIVSDRRKRWDLVRRGVLVILLPIGLWVVIGVIMLVGSAVMN